MGEDLKSNERMVLLLSFRAVGNLGGYCRVSIVIKHHITVTVTQGCLQVSLEGPQGAVSQKDKECLQLSEKLGLCRPFSSQLCIRSIKDRCLRPL